MSDDEMTEHRPLLRIRTERDANTVRVAGFGGVILRASTPVNAEDATFAHECRAQNLSVWLDLNTLAAPYEGLRKQQLLFDDLAPRFETANADLDTLHPHSAGVAIEVLEAFGDTLSGAIFDGTPHHSASNLFPPFPWSPNLPQSFQARQGFNILNRIETLVSSGGDEAARIRQQFWDEVHHAEHMNFIRPVCDWLQARNLRFCARNFRAEYHAFALDKPLLARLDASAVALENATPFPSLLDDDGHRIKDFHRLLHAGSTAFAREYSAEATARYWPVLASAPDVLWNQTIARATNAFANSRSAAKVGVLFPARSAQTHYHPDGHRFTRWVGDDLKLVTETLDDLHFDWLFVNEDQIASANQTGSTLQVGSARHELEMIVVPSVTALSWQTWETLERFAETGGRVACLGLLPRWSERGRDRALEALIGKTTRIVVDDLYQAYAALEGEVAMPPTIGYPIFREYHSGGRLCCYQPQLNADAEDARLRVRQILHESTSPVFETLAPDIRYTHRIGESRDLFFTANEGEQTRRVNAQFRPRQSGAPLEFDAATGEAKPVFVAMPYSPDEGGGFGISFDLAPAQARFFTAQKSDSQDWQSLERATFEVDYFDGETASGFMTQNGTPQVARRQAGKIVWHSAADVTVPIPILLDGDEWSQASFGNRVEYSQSVTIPAEWKECRLFLEVAATQFPVQCIVNGAETEIRLSSPFRFDITLLLAFGASNDFTLRAWTTEQEYSPPARLVAYPAVTVKIRP